MTDRKNFGEVFEGKNPRGTPEVQLRRFIQQDYSKYRMRVQNTVGIFWGPDLIGTIEFEDLFDENGNRFYND
jgi:hypothetical protein